MKSKNVKFYTKFKNVHYRDLKFENITYSFLKSFENYHLASGNELNGLAVYMRTIRSIYNQAIKMNLVNRALYPFHDYKIRTTETKKWALEQPLIKMIIDLKLDSAYPCFDARNYLWQAICYMG